MKEEEHLENLELLLELNKRMDRMIKILEQIEKNTSHPWSVSPG